MVDISKYRYNSSPIMDGLSNGGYVKYSFNFVRVSSHLLVHWKAFLKTLKNGKHLFVTLETNLFKAATFLVKLCISFTILGDVISMIALTFIGFASILYWDTMKPRNFPEETPKTHLVGFGFILYLPNVLKVSFRLSR